MRILAIDPGGTTGLCVYSDDSVYLSQLDTASIWPRLDRTTWDGRHKAGRFDAALVETYRPVRTSEPGPAEINGAARLLAMHHGAIFRAYPPSQAKSLAPNALLDRLGWRDPKLPHAADAARLIVCFALLDCPVETKEQQALVTKVRAAVMAGEGEAA